MKAERRTRIERALPTVTSANRSSELETLIRDLGAIRVFEGLSSEERHLVAEHCQRRRFYKGEVVFEDSDQGDDLFAILEGRVTIRLESISPHYEMVIGALGRGEVFGETGILGQPERYVTIVCGEPTEILQIDGKALLSVFEKHPDLGYKVISSLGRTLCERLYQLNRRLLNATRVNHF